MKLLVVFLLQGCTLLSCFGQSSIINDIFNSSLTSTKFDYKSDTYDLIEYKIDDENHVRYGLTVCFIKIPLDRVNLKIDEIRQYDSVRYIFENNKLSTDLVISNGGFFGLDDNHQRVPLGLVISDGATLNSNANWKEGGILFQINDTVGIIHISEYNNQKFQQAIQCKPILVRNSRLDIYSNSYDFFDRISIGITNEDELIICGAFNKEGTCLSLFEFAEFLSSCPQMPCPNLKISLYLDGGPSAHIFIPGLNKHYGYSGVNYLPNIIHISTN